MSSAYHFKPVFLHDSINYFDNMFHLHGFLMLMKYLCRPYRHLNCLQIMRILHISRQSYWDMGSNHLQGANKNTSKLFISQLK